MHKYDLSIILPGIRINLWDQLYFSAEKSVEPYTFQFILIGPYEPSENLKQKENFKYIKDFGCPSRCVQLGTSIAEGEYMCWTSDDGLFQPNSLAQCIQLFENKLQHKDGISLRYIEGNNIQDFHDQYWTAHYHSDLRLQFIPKCYNIAPLAMYNLNYFRDIGGLDCRYEHINFCTHDLAFRVQNNGGYIHLSPSFVSKFYWSWITSDAQPVQDAYFKNDKNLMVEEWHNKNQENRIKIDYWNWTKIPSKWSRRFK